MNVIFLFIPSLLKMDKFATFDVLVRSECAPGFPSLFSDSTFDKLCMICESKVTCGLNVLRLSEDKLMDWLVGAFNQICETAHRICDYSQICQLKAIFVSSGGAPFSPEVASDSAAASRELDSSILKNLAFQIIADRLPYQLVDKLFSSLGLVALPAEDKENDHVEGSGESKAFRSEANHGSSTEGYLTNVSAGKPVMVSKHSVKVLDSEAGLPSHHLIVLEAVRRHFGRCEVCCVRLADQRDLIAVAKVDETILDVFVPCNAPAAPSSISWTAEHLVHRLLPPSSFNRPLTDAISSHLRRQLDEGSVRFHLVFLDADCRPLFVTAQRGFMDAFEFDTVMSERRQTRHPPRRLASSIVRSGHPLPIMETFDLPDPGISTDTDDQCI
ncbi:hypothetical protein TSMEX_008778 [Taenia solium]|eukprot:TsM_000799500 transcript=TsM_000799500 gene=TsM_000799500